MLHPDDDEAALVDLGDELGRRGGNGPKRWFEEAGGGVYLVHVPRGEDLRPLGKALVVGEFLVVPQGLGGLGLRGASDGHKGYAAKEYCTR